MGKENEAQDLDESVENEVPDVAVSARAWAVLSYISFLCFVPLLTQREDDFVLEHARQGLMLFVTSLLLIVVGFTSGLGHLLMHFGNIFVVLFSVMGIYYALMGSRWTMPLLGRPALALKEAQNS
ncbi:MAG: hypothetical protein COB53_10845 [Elusimicrobia bacterium]|nr:MAG: hypothetical protein COB53_10845 [Elusimicrobiota bacterium]